MANFETRLRRAQAQSLTQAIRRASRLVSELAFARDPVGPGPGPSAAHLALYPHIDVGGTRPSVLAERVGITPQAVAQLVRDLEALGLVERTADPDDRRARRVAFTAAGERSILEGFARLRPLERDLTKALGARKTARLHRLLDELAAVCQELAERDDSA